MAILSQSCTEAARGATKHAASLDEAEARTQAGVASCLYDDALIAEPRVALRVEL